MWFSFLRNKFLYFKNHICQEFKIQDYIVTSSAVCLYRDWEYQREIKQEKTPILDFLRKLDK